MDLIAIKVDLSVYILYKLNEVSWSRNIKDDKYGTCTYVASYLGHA